MSYKQYDEKFKEEAVKLVTEQGLSHEVASAELGIPSTTLGNWIYKERTEIKGLQQKKIQGCNY